MSNVTIRIKDNGPLVVEGPITVIDGEGKSYPLPDKPAIGLCRCGASARKPFCDGAHKAAGFDSAIRCPEPPPAAGA